jgi:uncharacterized cupredoxin-like copper-binding protein
MQFKDLAALTLCATLTLVASSTVFAHGNEGHDSGATATPLSTPYGTPGSVAKVSRTIALDASDDMRFSKPDIRVRRGETIRFLITNTGQVRHEFSLGTRQELLEHYEMMKKFPDMVHEEANKVTLEPGSKGEVIWTFSKPGVVDFACLHPGHYEAGMKGQIKVASNK